MRIAKFILEMFFWGLAAGVLLFGAGLLIGVVVAPVLGYVAAVLMLGAMPLIVRLARTVRRRRAVAAISYLEQAVRLNLPLARMLYAAQCAEHGPLAQRLAAFRQLLEDGYPIGPALAAAVPEVGEREAALIEAGERTGRLPQVLRKLVTEQPLEIARRQTDELAFYRTYPFVMAVIMTGVLAMLAIFVMPKYEAIFADFAIQLPTITVNTMRTAAVLGPFLLLLAGAAVLIWTGLALWQTFNPVRFTSIFGRGVRDRIVWATPIARGIARDRGLADAFDLIAGAVRNGLPIERALMEAAQLDINIALSRRLERWAERLLGGMTLAEGARAAGMPRMVVAMLGTIRGGEAAAEVFRFLSRYYQTRYSRAAAIAAGAAGPIIVLFFAALVACVALAMFLPMIDLIDHLAPAMEVL